jgi:hypothetical protein
MPRVPEVVPLHPPALRPVIVLLVLVLAVLSPPHPVVIDRLHLRSHPTVARRHGGGWRVVCSGVVWGVDGVGGEHP